MLLLVKQITITHTI